MLGTEDCDLGLVAMDTVWTTAEAYRSVSGLTVYFRHPISDEVIVVKKR